MIKLLTQRFLGNRYFIMKNMLVDFNLGIFYRIYKVQSEGLKDFNYNTLDNFMILVKRANYGDISGESIYSSVVSSLYDMINQKFANLNIQNLSEEESTSVSSKYIDEYTKENKLLDLFSEELKKNFINQEPETVYYIFIPQFFLSNKQSLISSQKAYASFIKKYYKEYNDLKTKIKKDKKYTKEQFLNDYLNLSSMYDSFADNQYNSLLSNINEQPKNEALLKLYNLNKQYTEKIKLNEVSVAEANSLFDSFFYKSFYIGNSYITSIDLYSNQLFKDKTDYFPIIKEIFLDFDNFSIKESNGFFSNYQNTSTFFGSLTLTQISKTKNLFSDLSKVDGNFDFIVKVSKTNKNFISNTVIKGIIDKASLTIPSFSSNENETYANKKENEVSVIKTIEYYKNLKDKIDAVGEETFSVSFYIVFKIKSFDMISEIPNKFSNINISVSQLNPSIMSQMINMQKDYDVFIMHTKPLNIYLSFNNI
jgi:hypothetical protein